MDTSSVVSVRLTSEMKEKLEAEAEIEGVSLNTIVAKVLSKHIEWDRFAKDIGFCAVTKPFLRSLLEFSDEKAIKNLAVSICRGAMRDAMIFINGHLDYPAFAKTLDLWLHAANVPFRHITDEKGNDRYVVQHQLGSKWSVYFSTVLGSILSEIVGYRMENQSYDSDSLSFTIVKSSDSRTS